VSPKPVPGVAKTLSLREYERGFPRLVASSQRLDASGRFFAALRRFMPTLMARVIAVEGALTPREVQTALRALQARHPLLRARLAADPEPRFEHGVAGPLLLRVVQRESDQHWQSELSGLLNRPGTTGSSPLFAVCYVYGEHARRGELILIADHAIADGVSMNSLCAELLQLCKRGASLPTRPTLPTLEQLLPHRSRWEKASSFGLALGRMARVLVSRTLRERRTPAAGTVHVCRELTALHTRRLLARSRLERTTITGALLAATVLTLESRHPGHPQLAVTVPVDLRPRLPARTVSAADLGHYTSVVYLSTRAQSSLWPLARALKAQLEQTVTSRRLLAAVPLVYRAGRAFMRKNMPPLAHAMVSNSGVVPFAPDYGSFRAVGFYSATSAPMLSADYAFFCNTLHGRLTLNLVFSEQVLSRSDAERTLSHVVDLLTSDAWSTA
jgi:Condensation domain